MIVTVTDGQQGDIFTTTTTTLDLFLQTQVSLNISIQQLDAKKITNIKFNVLICLPAQPFQTITVHSSHCP